MKTILIIGIIIGIIIVASVVGIPLGLYYKDREVRLLACDEVKDECDRFECLAKNWGHLEVEQRLMQQAINCRLKKIQEEASV